ncbi:MAG: hypothetical protein KDD39_10745, partial [Bdellovibrionales bacterium]|nr:hypothetical protein [Bdellovibrionales bacterium]
MRGLKYMLGSLFLLGFCLSGYSAERIDPVKATASGVSDFGFELFLSLYSKDPKDPVAISPMSIAEAVTLATYGSEKETKKELESLFISEALKKEGADVKMLSYGLGNIRKSLKEYAAKSDGIFEYQSANSLWANNNPDVDFKFRASFVKVAEKEFAAESFARDFAATEEVEGEKVQSTVREANNWVSTQTKEKIKKLLSKLSDDDVAIILNAVYAKGKFRAHFNKLKEGEYTRDGAAKPETVTYMTKNEDMGYFEDKTVKAFSFNVGPQNDEGETPPDQIAVDILVPKSGKLSDLAAVLSGSYYGKVIAGMKQETVELTIPAGKVEQQEAAKLKESLQAAPFRVARPFAEKSAQFKPLGSVKGDLNLYINDILTKTFYEVTPFGFEAAAATAVVFSRESAVIPTQPVVAKVESASLHVVRHIPTGLPLFVVEYDSPKRYTEKELIELVELGSKNRRSLSAEVKDGTLRVGYDEKTEKSVLGVFDKEYKLVRKI